MGFRLGHLQSYLDEYFFRFNSLLLPDDRFPLCFGVAAEECPADLRSNCTRGTWTCAAQPSARVLDENALLSSRKWRARRGESLLGSQTLAPLIVSYAFIALGTPIESTYGVAQERDYPC